MGETFRDDARRAIREGVTAFPSGFAVVRLGFPFTADAANQIQPGATMNSDQEMRKLAQKFMNSRDDEQCIVTLLRMHCIFGQIRKMLGCSQIDRYKFEFGVKGGRIDLALFHTDGGVSLVEAKGSHDVRTVAAGIGQLFLYEAMYSAFKPKAKPPAYIHKYLVAPIEGEAVRIVDIACARAGVRFISYAPFALIKEHRADCRKKWTDHGTQVSINAGAMG